MTNFEIKPNTGSIFKNEKKSEKTPDYRGKINVDGVEKEISLWVKKSAKGTSYFSASIQEPYVKNEEVDRKDAAIKATSFDNGDLPF